MLMMYKQPWSSFNCRVWNRNRKPKSGTCYYLWITLAIDISSISISILWDRLYDAEQECMVPSFGLRSPNALLGLLLTLFMVGSRGPFCLSLLRSLSLLTPFQLASFYPLVLTYSFRCLKDCFLSLSGSSPSLLSRKNTRQTRWVLSCEDHVSTDFEQHCVLMSYHERQGPLPSLSLQIGSY